MVLAPYLPLEHEALPIAFLIEAMEPFGMFATLNPILKSTPKFPLLLIVQACEYYSRVDPAVFPAAQKDDASSI